MLRTLTLFLAGTVFLAAVQNARADILYDNGTGPASMQRSLVSDASSTVFGGDDFTLDTDVTLTSVQWSGIYWIDNIPPSVDDFTIRIYQTGATLYSDLLHTFSVGDNVQRTDSGYDYDGIVDIYTYATDITPTNLAAGSYLISISNNTVEGDNDWFWAFEYGVAGTDVGYVTDNSPPAWTGPNAYTNRAILDFKLYGTTQPVPEPSSMVLLGMGVLGMGGYYGRRKLKQKHQADA